MCERATCELGGQPSRKPHHAGTLTLTLGLQPPASSLVYGTAGSQVKLLHYNVDEMSQKLNSVYLK